MRSFLISTAVLSLASFASGDAQRLVTGRLVDKETGQAVKDAEVTLLATGEKTTSNSMGFFQLKVDSAFTIAIASFEYAPMKVEIPTADNFKIELVGRLPPGSVEKSAEFPGGIKEFYAYLSKNLRLPREVREGKASGRVLVEFVVDSTGQILPQDVNILQPLCNTCDAEAVRLVRGSPDWIPGSSRGKPTRQKIALPITFMAPQIIKR